MARKTAEALPELCRLIWVKQGLPVLANRDQALEQLLLQAGLVRNPQERKDRTFTCDAMWAQGPGLYTVVYGPGSLLANGAHTEGEFIDLSDLETYARAVAVIIKALRAHIVSGGTQ